MLLANLSYKIINVDKNNVDVAGVFCQKSRRKEEGYRSKAAWVKERFEEGLRLKLLLVNEGPKRGFKSRGFIEYIPGEFTWRGISARGYMVIHCIWVVGRNKSKGYGGKLLRHCLNDAKGMNGVAVVTSKKGHWLPKPKLFIKYGFAKVDELPPDFELYAKRFEESAPLPKFNLLSKAKNAKGITILYSHQCPYLPAAIRVVEKVAEQASIPVEARLLTDCESAQNNGFHPYGTYCVLFKGEVLTYRFCSGKELIDQLRNRGVKI